MKSASLDQWRNYFESSNCDIFDVIDHAITVAATDSPNEFKLKRDGIAEKLFSCMLNRCSGFDKVEVAVAVNDDANAVVSDKEIDHGVKDGKPVSNHSYDHEAEALIDMIEAESGFYGEVMRIKEILHHHEYESDSVLFESLRKLELMNISLDLLKSTEIGRAVSPLRKIGPREVRDLADALIYGWKAMVCARLEEEETTTPITDTEGGTPESMNPSVVENAEEEEEGGLPSPPLDDGAFFVTQPGSIELSQFFDGMDDFGNPRQTARPNNNQNNGRKPALSNNQMKEKRNLPASNETMVTAIENKSQQIKKNEAAMRPNKPVAAVRPNKPVAAVRPNKPVAAVRPNKPVAAVRPNKPVAAVRPNKPVAADSVLRRPLNSNTQRKSNPVPKMKQNIENGTAVAKRPLNAQKDMSKFPDEATRLEASKRKLQERYQQVENAKRQRTVQVVELNDIPKQGAARRNTHFKAGNHNRQRGQVRR